MGSSNLTKMSIKKLCTWRLILLIKRLSVDGFLPGFEYVKAEFPLHCHIFRFYFAFWAWEQVEIGGWSFVLVCRAIWGLCAIWLANVKVVKRCATHTLSEYVKTFAHIRVSKKLWAIREVHVWADLANFHTFCAISTLSGQFDDFGTLTRHKWGMNSYLQLVTHPNVK